MPRRWPPGPQVRHVAGETTIFREDRLLLESATAAQTDADWRERSVEADAPTLLLRRIVELAGRGEWDASRAAAEGRRLVRVRCDPRGRRGDRARGVVRAGVRARSTRRSSLRMRGPERAEVSGVSRRVR